MKEWPSTRQNPRFRFDAAVNVVTPKYGTVRGWCHDISNGGLCGDVPSVLTMGDQVTLEFQIPKNGQMQRIRAKVCYARGLRYGFEFLAPDAVLCKRICDYGVQQRTSAFILSPNAPMVWNVQRILQQLGVSQVQTGAPKVFPIESPHLIVIDSEWPDFVEVIQFLRSESGSSLMTIVAVLSTPDSAAEVQSAGADLVLHKPLSPDRTKKNMELAFRLISAPAPKQESRQPELSGVEAAIARFRK